VNIGVVETVIQTVREKFTCRDCEKISQPPAPFHATPRGWAGPKLLATLLFEKFGQHQPLTLDVFVPQDLKRHMLALQFAVNISPIRLDAAAVPRLLAGSLIKRCLQNRVRDLLAERPCQPSGHDAPVLVVGEDSEHLREILSVDGAVAGSVEATDSKRLSL
jgi:hypothetical protein